MPHKTVLRSVVIITTFLLALYGNRILGTFVPVVIESDYLLLLYIYSWWAVPAVLVTGLMYGFRQIPELWGLSKGFGFGFVFALITVLPMLISSVVMGEVRDDLSLLSLLQKTVFAGFMEEFLFRGFLFGILFRKLCWGFVPASLLGALIFGIIHLYQGSSIAETAGIFLLTAMGAVWFAWLYIEWENNLWIPIFLHILMNLSWTLFDISDTALGGLYANLFRALTIAITVILTIRHCKKNGFKVNGRSLWGNGTYND